MNVKLTIVAEIIPSQATADNCLKYSVATIQDLRALKKLNPNSVVRQADITPHVRQNCDATVRVLSRTALHEIETHLPSAKATRLYLQASIWILEPFRNEKFGNPSEVVKSLWAGIMTWRRWRRYVELSEGLTLAQNFISRAHYLTLELMAHAGIIHQLALFLSFADLDVKDYNLRRTGNRNIEAIHSIFRGGASNLPITSANLTFQEFLCRMNKVMQISDAENALKKIPGNSLQSSKKRRLTYATSANEPSPSIAIGYQKPKTYQEFLRELTLACKQGDNDSKQEMEKLVPHLVKHLKLTKQWDSPSHGLSTPDEALSLISSEQEFRDVKSLENVFDEIISLHLDKNSRGESSSDKTIDDNDETSWHCASESTPISSADISVLESDSFHSTHASTEVDSVSTGALTVSESAGSNSCKHSDASQDSESPVVECCQHMHMAASSSSDSTMIGSLHCTTPICESTDVHNDCNEAICNLLMDIDLERYDGAINPTKHASTVLKHLQPYREKPSKDRGKRFHCGSLYGDAEKPENHDIELFEFWAIKPTSKVLCRAHFFSLDKLLAW